MKGEGGELRVMIVIEGPLSQFSISLIQGVHNGTRAMLDIPYRLKKLIWFGYIARLSQWGGGGYFTCSNDVYLT
jgi:hypothetical protein